MDTSHWASHRHHFTVDTNLADEMGHLNNVAYFKLFEDARWQMISGRGYDLQTMNKLQQGPVILKVEAEFRKEVRSNQAYYIDSTHISYEGKILKILQEFKSEGEILHCRAIYTLGLFDMRERRLVLPSEEWLHACGKPH